jgi:hypothetical protein
LPLLAGPENEFMSEKTKIALMPKTFSAFEFAQVSGAISFEVDGIVTRITKRLSCIHQRFELLKSKASILSGQFHCA